MNTKDQNTITQWAEDQPKHQAEDLQIKFMASGHESDNKLEQFCDMLTQLAPCIKIDKGRDSDIELPEIRVRKNIIYSAVPLAMELKPFLKALSLASGTSSSENGTPKKTAKGTISLVPEKIKQDLEKIDIPVQLTLYVAEACPHCPGVVNTILPMAFACDHIFLTIIDGTLFTEKAAKNSVMSAPCLILDDDFRWTGAVSLEEVTDMIVNRKAANLSASTLKMILEDGRAAWIAHQMMEQNRIFSGFIDLLTHEIWSVRLGAMVILEELAEENRALAAKIAPPLWKIFDKADIPVKGDILYALGEAGDIKIKQEILDITKTLENQDLKDAAMEAVENIESR